MKQKCLALLVAGTLLCSALVGCTKTYATDLMDGVKEGTPTEVQVQEETWAGMQDFSGKLLQTTCDREENTLVSLMSVLSALAMTANGTRGATRATMANILGGSGEQPHGASAGLGQEQQVGGLGHGLHGVHPGQHRLAGEVALEDVPRRVNV